MDTETSGLSFDSAGFVFMIGLSYFVPDGLVVDQFILPDLSGERAFLEAVRATVERFDAFVTYNGKSFDVPMIHAREKVHFLPHAFDGLDGDAGLAAVLHEAGELEELAELDRPVDADRAQ